MSKAAFLFSLLSIAMLTSCATGEGGEEDGVIKGRADTRVSDTKGSDNDTGTATEEDSSTSDDGATEDTGGGADSGSSSETSSTDSGADTGSPPTDTDPTGCAAEEPEPNDTPATARVLTAIDDCDGSGKSIGGVLSSSTDVDVLTYDGTDTFGCSVNPSVKATGPVRVCLKAVCKSATTEFKSCPKGTATAGECCGTEVEIDVNCAGTTSEDTKVTMTVRGDGSSLMCAAYSLAYHY